MKLHFNLPQYLPSENTVNVTPAGATLEVKLQPRPVRVVFKWYPPEEIIRQALAWRLIDVTEASLWAAIESIAPKIGCVPQTLNEWVKRAEVDAGVREGVTTSEAQRVKDLEREVRELRKANEILKLASAFFAQAELDRRIKS